MIVCETLRAQLINKEIAIEDLAEFKSNFFEPMCKDILNGKIDVNISYLRDYLYLCLDYYTFTDDVLIPDYDYDMLMSIYISMGGTRFSTADPLDITTWPIVDHEDRSMVGSITKVYDEDELESYWRRYSHYRRWVAGPKYDGISASVKVVNGVVKKAWTRYNGLQGQDITAVVINAKNADTFMYHFDTSKCDPDGFYKVELAVGNEDFAQLVEEKPYANRRSATSGIVNTPKNIHLAKYITIIPLAKKSMNGVLEYKPLGARIIDDVGSSAYLMRCIKDVLHECIDESFQFRYDGVVVFPLLMSYNDNDILDDAIAYKINTKYGFTKVKRLYISIGRTGKAMPMAEVYPVEVNETRVTDISLGSFGNYVNMDIRKDEQICVYSAGDVIPQIMKPDKTYDKTGERLFLKLVCPYCGENLHSFGREMYCINKDCIRIKVGNIANFCSKIGIENISDATIEALHKAGLITCISDLFYLDPDKIAVLPGFGTQSAEMIINNINEIKDKPIYVDTFFGALGIPDCAELTCRKIFSIISIKDIKRADRKNKWNDLEMEVQYIKGIGNKIAKSFIKYLKENIDEVMELLDHIDVVGLPNFKGSVVFTGFRSEEYELKFELIGYEVSKNVTKDTKVLINQSRVNTSTKCISAIKNEVPIVHVSRIDEVLDYLYRGKNLWNLVENNVEESQ